jgi:heat shock protein 1/8
LVLIGCSYSCVGVWQNDRVEILANDQGNRTTPSYVGFTDTERLIGEAAYNQASINPSNTVFDAKRMIGRKFSDEEIQRDIKLWPFKVVQKQGDKPFIQVEYLGETREFAPEEISSMVLTKMKETAEMCMGGKVTDAVITVPAYFNDAQRVATKDAGRIAGLNVLRIINEPTAAAIAYGLEQMGGKEQNILVFDYGGGTLDVSILSIEGGVFEVKATGGDTHLGGEDLDNKLVEYFAAEFRRKHKLDISSSQRALRRLRTACERLKRSLSSSVQANLEIDSLYEGIDFYTSLSRARFEELCMDYFRQCISIVIKTLHDSKIDKSSIDEIVLVGGSTRIPKIQQMLEGLFEGKKVNKSINPDEAVAYGAAVQAAIITGAAKGGKVDDVLLLDVVPLSLGIATQGGVMATIIDRNTTVPTKKKKIFSTTQDNQSFVEIKVYEGERVNVRDNNLLGRFVLEGIPPAKRAQPQIEVTFDVSAEGILTVTAEDLTSKKKSNITITNDKGRLSEAEIKRMLNEAERFRQHDQELAEMLDWRNSIENKVYNIRSTMEDKAVAEALGADEREKLESLTSATLQWLDAHPHGKISLDDLKAKMREIDSVYNPIITNVYKKLPHQTVPEQGQGAGAGAGEEPHHDHTHDH